MAGIGNKMRGAPATVVGHVMRWGAEDLIRADIIVYVMEGDPISG